MNTTELSSRYVLAWRTFIDEMRCIQDIFHAASGLSLEGASDLHDLVAQVQRVPYQQAHNLFASRLADCSSNNIGSVTGLFFEQNAAALIIGYMRRHVADVRVECNTCSDQQVSAVARDPDVFLTLETRRVVFEVKASPKKRDLERARQLRQQYESQNVRFYLVGGKVSLAPCALQPLTNERWACFTRASKRNTLPLKTLPRLDELLVNASAFLTRACD